MGVLDKLKNYMLGAEEADDYEYEYEEVEEEKPAPSYSAPYTKKETVSSPRPSVASVPSSSSSSKVINFKNNVQLEVVITFPTNVSEATSISNALRDGKTCVVNLEGVEKSNAQRVADFLGGTAYALDAEIQRISNEIFIIAPVNVNVSGELKEELKSNGLMFSWSTAFAR